MKNPKAIVDTGIIALFLSSNPPIKVKEFINDIKSQKIDAITLALTFTEAFKHICVKKGKDYAKSALLAFQTEVPIEIIDMDVSLALEAGILKCQFRDKLSYIDSSLIALTIFQNGILHTTEKDLPDINGLKIKKYVF